MAVTIGQIFNELLPSRIEQNPEMSTPAFGPTPDPVIQLVVQGDVDHAGPWIIDFTAEQGQRVIKGRTENKNFTVIGSAAIFKQLWEGNIDPREAIQNSELNIAGKTRLGAFFYSQYYRPQG